MQFARAAGADRVVGIVGNPGQADHARKVGYDQVLSREEFPQALDGEHFDVILDPIGGQTRLDNLDRLAPHGRIVVYGNLTTFEPVSVSANDLLVRGTSMLTYNSSLLSRTRPERLAASARRALELVGNGEVGIEITAEYELAGAGTTIAAIADGATHGKSIVRIA